MKKIMILGAGRGQTGLVKAAKKYGYCPIVTSIDGDWPGFKLVEEKCIADISNPAAILEKAKEYNIDGVATSCLDTGMKSLGFVCDELHLSGISMDAAKKCSDKSLMKEAFVNKGVRTAKYKKVSNINELHSAINELHFPIIIKAIDLQGSRGINIVREVDKVDSAYNNTMSETKCNYCIVEEFLEGEEFGAQAFVYNGEIIYFLPCGDITYSSYTNIPVGHYAPIKLSTSDFDDARNQVELAINALGLDNCAVNVDFIKSNGKTYVIEITGRVGANCLPEIVSVYYGIDVYKMILDASLGLDVKKYFAENKKEPMACYAKILYSEKRGILKKITNNNELEENVIDISFYVKEGQKINAFTNSKDCIGQVIVKANDFDSAEKLINEVIENIQFEIK